jgi:CubicO group peptidase (beta-lactamase class C family)
MDRKGICPGVKVIERDEQHIYKRLSSYIQFMRIQTCLLALTLTLPGILPVQGQDLPVSRLDSLAAKAVELGVFSGNVLLERGGTIAYERSYGLADTEKKIPNNSSTLFQIASITKDFTRTMMLQLEEQGKLRLSDNLGKYLEGFSPEVSAVTLHQLLYFTSGLGDYHQSDEFRTMAGRVVSIQDILLLVKKEKLAFTPGSRFRYSNSGYVALAAIIEKVTGRNYVQSLKGMILDKCGMTHTGANGIPPLLPGMAKGYLTNEIGPVKENADVVLSCTGDGGLYTDTHDLLAFVRALFRTNILLSDSGKFKFVSRPLAKQQATSWADFASTGRHAAAGGAPGVSAVYAINMKASTIMIVLSNFDMGTAEDLQSRMAAITYGMPLEPLHEPPSKYLFGVIRKKGGAYFEQESEKEMKASGMEMDDDMVLLSVGQALRAAGDNANAISLYKVYTSRYPNIIIAWNELGECHSIAGEKEKARACFEKALAIQPNNRRALENMKKF